MTWLYTALYEENILTKTPLLTWDLKVRRFLSLERLMKRRGQDQLIDEVKAYVPLSSIHIDTKTKEIWKTCKKE